MAPATLSIFDKHALLEAGAETVDGIEFSDMPSGSTVVDKDGSFCVTAAGAKYYEFQLFSGPLQPAGVTFSPGEYCVTVVLVPKAKAKP